MAAAAAVFPVFAVFAVIAAYGEHTPSTAAGAPGVPEVRLTRVGSAVRPVALLEAPGSRQLIVVEKRGVIRALDNSQTLLEVSDQVSRGNEQGLLDLAFSADGTLAFVNLTNTDGDTEIREYAVQDGKFAADSMRLLLRIAQPFANHNGGQLAVDPSGLLWIGTGDGGAGGDPQRHGQNRQSLLGKILRIDPRPSGGRAYRIPSTNPFADGKSGRPEIWAYGLRNPWRFSFDEPTAMLWIADVGQNQWEEINAVPRNRAGLNFGWNKREGRHAFDGGSKPRGAVDPVYEYSHGSGCSVTGGYVYRGTRLAGLAGAYVFADYCAGELLALRQRRGSAAWQAVRLGASAPAITSFAVGRAGELYVLSDRGAVLRLDPA